MTVSNHQPTSPAAHTRGTRGRDWDERNNAHASVVTVHRETLFAPAHPKRPIFDDCEHAWAVFVSVKRHATNKSTTLGRYFFHQNPYGRPQAAAGPGCNTHGQRRHHRHPYFARNLSRSFFETPQKRCNSNDANSMFEQAAGELRAKLMGGGGAWPGFKATRRAKLAARTASGRAAAHGAARPHWCGGRRRGRRAWPRCRWAAAGDYRSRTWCLSSVFRLGLRAKVAVI